MAMHQGIGVRACHLESDRRERASGLGASPLLSAGADMLDGIWTSSCRSSTWEWRDRSERPRRFLDPL